MTLDPVPVNIPLLGNREREYLERCIETGWISSEGPFVKEFEDKYLEDISSPHMASINHAPKIYYTESFKNNDTNDANKVIVLFHANWCGHCQQIKPVWGNFEKESKVKTMKFESDTNPDIMKKFNIKGFPTILKIKNFNSDKPEIIEKYNGNRTLKSLIKFSQN